MSSTAERLKKRDCMTGIIWGYTSNARLWMSRYFSSLTANAQRANPSVYMTAASNKFLRRYYAKVRDYLATLEDLPLVELDSTGLQRS